MSGQGACARHTLIRDSHTTVNTNKDRPSRPEPRLGPPRSTAAQAVRFRREGTPFPLGLTLTRPSPRPMAGVPAMPGSAGVPAANGRTAGVPAAVVDGRRTGRLRPGRPVPNGSDQTTIRHTWNTGPCLLCRNLGKLHQHVHGHGDAKQTPTNATLRQLHHGAFRTGRGVTQHNFRHPHFPPPGFVTRPRLGPFLYPIAHRLLILRRHRTNSQRINHHDPPTPLGAHATKKTG